MFCQKCGGKLAEGDRFCTFCGAKASLTDVPLRTSEPVNMEMSAEPVNPEDSLVMRKKRFPLWVIITVIGFIAVSLAAAAAVLFVFRKTTVELNNYITVSFEGYDTEGKAKVSFDIEEFRKEHGKKLSDSFLYKCVDGKLDKTSGLSNGDTVKYIWDCDDDTAIKEYNCRLEYSNMLYTVEGLKQKIEREDSEVVEYYVEPEQELKGEQIDTAEDRQNSISGREDAAEKEQSAIEEADGDAPDREEAEGDAPDRDEAEGDALSRGEADGDVLSREEDVEKERTETGMIFPYSSEQPVDEAAVSALSDEELRYAINEIYARNGYIFRDNGLRAYYNGFDWYEERIPAADFTASIFNPVERSNVEMMQKERDRRH